MKTASTNARIAVAQPGPACAPSRAQQRPHPPEQARARVASRRGVLGRLINTPLQRGVQRPQVNKNRFNGFCRLRATVETVNQSSLQPNTLLKGGVNETELPGALRTSLRPGTGALRRRMASGMTLIEIICIVAILGILAVVLLRALLREIDYDVSREERGLLRSYNGAFRQGIARNGCIPSENNWAALVASQEGVDVSSVAQNRRHQQRRLLIDTNGWLNTVTLPWTQPQEGTSIMPTNARVMIVTSLGAALPSTLPAGPTAPAVFNPLWNGTNNFTAGAWAGWGGQAADVLVEPVNLTPLFVALYIATAGDYAAQGQYTIGTNQTLLSAPNQHLNAPSDPRYLLAGTSVNLYHASPSNTLDAIQILNKDSSFFYERGIWKSSAAGGILPGGVDIAAVVNAFLNAPYNQHAQNTTPYPEIQQYLVVDGMMSYMSNYVVWASGTTSTTSFGDNNLYLYLKNNVQPTMMSNIQGLFMGSSGNYPVNTSPCK